MWQKEREQKKNGLFRSEIIEDWFEVAVEWKKIDNATILPVVHDSLTINDLKLIILQTQTNNSVNVKFFNPKDRCSLTLHLIAFRKIYELWKDESTHKHK